jgi:O-antigen/teichoic acid export membrane protein
MTMGQAAGSGELSRVSLTRVTSILLLGRLFGVVFGLINAIVLARVLGVEALGEYAYAMGLVALFGLVPNAGLSTVITRAIAIDPDRTGLLFSTAQKTQVWLSLGVFTAIMAMAMILPRHLVSMSDLALAGGQLVLGALSIPYLAVLAGRARYDLVAVIELSVACLGTVSFLAVAALNGGLTAFLGAQIVNATGSVVIARLIAGKYLPGNPGASCSMAALLRQGLPFGAVSILQNVYTRLDILLLGQLSTSVMVGLYSTAYKPVNMLLNFGASASGTLFPYLVQESRTASSGSFERVFKLVMVLAPVMAFVIGGLSEPLIKVMFGVDYAPAAAMLTILAWSAAANWLYAPIGIALQARGYERMWMSGLAGALLLNAALNLWAIPRWGGLGAAVSTLACEVMLLLASSIMLRRAFGPLLPMQAAPACVGATIVGVVVLVGLRDMGTIVATGAALLGYGVVLWCFRVATADDVFKLVARFRETAQGHARV